jgi:[ribosomal protein S18]-alanine N-acetyltransferase
MLNMRLLPMAVADLDEVCEIEQQSHWAPWSQGNFNDSLVAGYWAYSLRKLAQLDHQRDELMAYCVLMPGIDELNLLNITVSPEYRRQGLAKKILLIMEDLARERGLTKVFLEVRVSNAPAIALYQELGYSEVGLRKEYYPVHEGCREDAKVMMKELN